MPSLLNTVRDLGRLREITGVLVRHGFGEFVQRAELSSLVPLRNRTHTTSPSGVGPRLRAVLEELGPSFVKLGQIASTRADLLPDDVIHELKKLQEHVEPVEFPLVRAVIESQLGRELPEVFANFDETPLASASIGQVYRAQLRTADGTPGAKVVVKVQRPDIARTVERDADLLYWLAHGLERSIPELSVYGPVRLAQEFDRTMRAELDYTQEADNADRFRENFASDERTLFPIVYREASARKVLTLEYFPGYNLFDAIEKGANGEDIARQAISLIFRMIFEHGFFHADPHPGNILILPPLDSPVLGIIDLGQVGRLTVKVRDNLLDLIIALGRNDTRAIATALCTLGRPQKKIDRVAFEAHVGEMVDRYLGRKLKDIQASVALRDIMKGAMDFGLELPADLMMMGKALTTIEGIARQIYPDFNLVQELKPHMAEILGIRYSPERMTSDLFNLANRFATATSEFPTRAEDILEDLRQGRLRIETRQPSTLEGLDRASKRINGAAIEAALILGGSGLIAVGKTLLGATLFAGAAFLFSWTALTLAFSRNKRSR